ncbi:TrbC/VirB2 family protein [Paraburkholderia strydomiana]|uniref:TrbC/VirB2 family protein n=1 Tax=Paraburkholderia strydomiana TaxID=1245417 RepID=UPI0038B6D20B
MKSGLQMKWITIRLALWFLASVLTGRNGLGIAALLTVTPAYAQLSQVNTLLTTIQTTLLSVGAVVCSISIIWAGFKMMFQHARFGDIANVFIGGLFVGCATVIAAMLIPTS